MNINSQFFITNYTGKESLDLMTKPVSITELEDIADYNRFIEGITTIYGSQNATGGIPVFWTIRNPTTDSVGHTKNTYVPSPESTLKALSPREAYYFIVRDTSYLPISIPILGGTSPGFVDDIESKDYILPIINSPSGTTLTSSSGNINTFTVSLDKLQPQETYKYVFQTVSSNWPIIMGPISGLLKPSEEQDSINTTLTFCSSSGMCTSGTIGLLPPTTDNNQSCLISNNIVHKPYATLQMSLEPVASTNDFTILSKQFTVSCDDCLPRLNVVMPTDPVSLSGHNNYCHDVITMVSGLVPNQTYSYSFKSVVGNWPAVMTPSTGLFKASKTSSEIRSRLAFCPTPIICSGGTPGILDYDLNSYQYLFDNTCGKFVTIELSVQENSCGSLEGISDRLTIYCLDCLGDTMVPSLTISATQT
jgi:hypothetical protein